MMAMGRYNNGLGATPEELQAQMAAMTAEINDIIARKSAVDAQIADLEAKITAATGTTPAPTPGVDPALLATTPTQLATGGMFTLWGMPWYLPIGAGALGLVVLTKLLRR